MLHMASRAFALSHRHTGRPNLYTHVFFQDGRLKGTMRLIRGVLWLEDTGRSKRCGASVCNLNREAFGFVIAFAHVCALFTVYQSAVLFASPMPIRSKDCCAIWQYPF